MSKNIKIKDEYVTKLREVENIGWINETNVLIEGHQFLSCNISKFRFYLHTIIDKVYDFSKLEEKRATELADRINDEISNNNFTTLFILDILETTELTCEDMLGYTIN